jgi:hypothetical protein
VSPGFEPAAVAVRVAVHQPSPDRTQAVSLDSAPDLSCTNSTQAHCVDVEHQPTDLAVGFPFSAQACAQLGGDGGDCTAHAADRMDSVLASHGGVLLASGGDR